MGLIEFTASDAAPTNAHTYQPYPHSLPEYVAQVTTRHARRLTLRRSKRYGFVVGISSAAARAGTRIYLDHDALADLRDAINDFLGEAKEPNE